MQKKEPEKNPEKELAKNDEKTTESQKKNN
jgi:hypothetical protein